MIEISNHIKHKISLIGKPEKAKWLENYVKHNIKSKGVGIPEIRDIVKSTTDNFKLLDLEVSSQIIFLNALMTSEYAEEKLSAIIYIQLNWPKRYEKEKIKLISDWFDKGLITDWNICDWLCVRLLTPLLDENSYEAIVALKDWNKNQNQWKARASLVPFAQCKLLAKHTKLIEDFAVELIKRNERFCKTAVGWVLREYSKIDITFVNRFLTKYENHTTKEVIKNATKHLTK